jgi:hypothetical protein
MKAKRVQLSTQRLPKLRSVGTMSRRTPSIPAKLKMQPTGVRGQDRHFLLRRSSEFERETMRPSATYRISLSFSGDEEDD